MNQIKRHKELLDYLESITESKNRRYGSSVTKTFNEYGPLAYFIRIDDKINRAKQILLHAQDETHEGEPDDLVESVFDTLMDLANYTLLFVVDLEARKESQALGVKQTEGE